MSVITRFIAPTKRIRYVPDHCLLSDAAKAERRRQEAWWRFQESYLDELWWWWAKHHHRASLTRYLTRMRMFTHPREWPELDQEIRHCAVWRRQRGAMMFATRSYMTRPSSVSQVVYGAYYVDLVNGNDSNDGRLVSEGGTGPWQTWGRLATALDSTPEFSVGDHIYLRGGTYVPTALVRPTGGGSTLNSQKITLEGYPGETATIDWSVNDDRTMTDPVTGQAALIARSANYRFKKFSFISYIYGVGVENGIYGMGSEYLGLKHTRFGTATSTGNVESNIAVDDGSNNNDFLIEGCDLRDGNAVSGNGNTVYFIRATGTIRNNFIGAGGTSGYALHDKRMNNSTVLGNITIENNLISRYESGTGCIFYNNTQYGLIRNNIFSGADFGQAIYGSDSGSGASSPPWYRNQLLHNTTRRVSGSNGYGLCGIDNNNLAGNAGTENTIRDNIVDGQTTVMQYQTAKTHNNVFNYNLYDPAPSIGYREFSATYNTLADWQGATTYMSAPDLDSFEETMVWDTAFDRWNPQAYRLGSGSSGINAASDATDIGADVDVVGPAAAGY